MGRKTARVSKKPEVHQQEILDAAMSVSMEEGYEAATVKDIAATIHVMPGLCYRYFESKQILYDIVIEQYIEDITYPMIKFLKGTEHSLDGFLGKMEQLFMQTNGKEEYHHFFHKEESHDLQMLMSVKLCETIEPYMEEKLRMMNKRGITRVKNILITASYMLFDVVPVLENDELSAAEKASGIRMMTKCILGL